MTCFLLAESINQGFIEMACLPEPLIPNSSHFSLCFYELSLLTTHLTPTVGLFLHTNQFSNSLDMESCNSVQFWH